MREIYWTKERCFNEALKYDSRAVFKKKSGGAYNASTKGGWLDNVCSHMKVCGNRVLRMVYVYEFSDKSVYVGLTYNIEERDKEHKRNKKSKVFQYIKEKNIIPFLSYSEYMNVEKAKVVEGDMVEKFKKRGYHILNVSKTGGVGSGFIKWTFEKCEQEAKKCKTKKEFYGKNNSAYNAAIRYGWLKKICSHMKTKKVKPKGYWTLERSTEEAKKYKTKKEFYLKSPSAYMVLLKKGILNNVCENMKTKKPNGYWTRERCEAESKKYSSITEFQIKSGGAYRASLKGCWLKEFKFKTN